jgi:hypothetical protein
VEVEEVQFTGTPKFFPNGTAYLEPDGHLEKYFGKPSPEIDDAWSALVGSACLETLLNDTRY